MAGQRHSRKRIMDRVPKCACFAGYSRKAGLLRTFPTFLSNQQARVGSLLRTEEFLPGASLLFNAQKTVSISMKEDLIDVFDFAPGHLFANRQMERPYTIPRLPRDSSLKRSGSRP